MTKNKPKDLSDGVSLFMKFHQLEPTKISEFATSMRIPERVHLLGNSEFIFYASNKWGEGTHYYKHRHGAEVHTYTTSGRGDRSIKVPGYITECETLVRLGVVAGPSPKELDELIDIAVENKKDPLKLIEDEDTYSSGRGRGVGFIYTDFKGYLQYAETESPFPELYCIPSGRALLVIDGKKSIRAMMWGGGLDVTKRGIVG